MSILQHAELRDIDSPHLKMVLNWRNQDHIRSAMYHDHKITIEEHKKWFEKVKKDKNTRVKIFYLQNVPLGVVNITKIDDNNSTCYWGFYIGEKNAPKGSGTIMGYLALKYIFEELKIRKLCAEVIGSNETSIRYHQKLGFNVEGILKKQILKNSRYEDIILMSIFQTDWEKQKEILKQLIEGMRI
jgi:UDP-4-amino-4,6-dideoxy-N-acetyl-beta-L-altrosamine N-acetyltransferase